MKSWSAVEHLAKFEQKLNAQKGKLTALENTSTIKKLSSEERIQFKNYQESKSFQKKLFSLTIFSLATLAILFKPEITGNVISDNPLLMNILSIIAILLLAIIVLVTGILRLKEKQRTEKYKKYMKELEKKIKKK